ncbi:hypothetical protein GCM10025794_26010 [Massilia kyonggiensis]
MTTPTSPSVTASGPASAAPGTVLQILFSVAFVHLLNDCVQAVLPSIYPLLKEQFALSFTQVGLITLTFQCTASLLQPWIGLYTDKRPIPFLLPAGMCVTLAGVALLAVAGTFPMLLLAAGMIGIGSSTFHPEASRVARLASGGRFGFAQSLFQVGGNLGSAFGPLLAAAIIVGRGQGRIAWFMLFILVAVIVLVGVSRWYGSHLKTMTRKAAAHAGPALPRESRHQPPARDPRHERALHRHASVRHVRGPARARRDRARARGERRAQGPLRRLPSPAGRHAGRGHHPAAR